MSKENGKCTAVGDAPVSKVLIGLIDPDVSPAKSVITLGIVITAARNTADTAFVEILKELFCS